MLVCADLGSNYCFYCLFMSQGMHVCARITAQTVEAYNCVQLQ